MLSRILFLSLTLTCLAWSQEWPQSADFPGPQELLRAARDLRLDLGDLGPIQFRGGANFGPGTPGGFNAGDLNQFSVAVSYFERACLRVEDPRDTIKAFHRLEQTYQRAWRSGPYGTASLRDIGQIMTRLEKFYAELETPPTPSPTPTEDPGPDV